MKKIPWELYFGLVFSLHAMNQDSTLDFLKIAIDRCYKSASIDPIKEFIKNNKKVEFTEGQVLNFIIPRRAQEFNKLSKGDGSLIDYLKRVDSINKIGLDIQKELKQLERK